VRCSRYFASALFPAECAFTFYGFESLIDQARFIQHSEKLRAGTFQIIRLDDIEGLISFPSFHVAGAVMVTWTFRSYRAWLWPLIVLNTGLIAATFMAGAHYVVDVLATLVIFAVSVWTYRYLQRTCSGSRAGREFCLGRTRQLGPFFHNVQHLRQILTAPYLRWLGLLLSIWTRANWQTCSPPDETPTVVGAITGVKESPGAHRLVGARPRQRGARRRDHRRRAETWPARDGLLLERAGGEPNYGFHGLALLALHAAGIEHAMGTGRCSAACGASKDRAGAISDQPTETTVSRHGPGSTIPSAGSSRPPWCLLALKTCAETCRAPVDDIRVRDAERMLADRSCRGGGWNYGNSNMLGKELMPYVPTTAVTLLALRDRGSEPFATEALAFLERHATFERSATALSLASRALRAYGRDTADVIAALREQLPITVALGNHCGPPPLRSTH